MPRRISRRRPRCSINRVTLRSKSRRVARGEPPPHAELSLSDAPSRRKLRRRSLCRNSSDKTFAAIRTRLRDFARLISTRSFGQLRSFLSRGHGNFQVQAGGAAHLSSGINKTQNGSRRSSKARARPLRRPRAGAVSPMSMSSYCKGATQHGLITFHQEMGEGDGGERRVAPCRPSTLFGSSGRPVEHCADRRMQVQPRGQGEIPW